MDSKWIKVMMDLRSNSFACVTTADANVSSSPRQDGSFDTVLYPLVTVRPSVETSVTSSPTLHSSKSLSGSSSSKICAICLASMKLGEAIFTSECAHSFHFQCIASNIKHGNQICPVCRANWKQFPLQTSTGRENSPQYDPAIRRRLPSATILPTNEPAVFNDDEPLDLQTSSTNDKTSDGSSLKMVILETYTELPAVPRFSTVDDFAVLIHLKAPVSTSSRTPVDLVTVLDISGSMAGIKLVLLKRAMGFVIQNLGPGDRLAVVVFSSTARRLFPLRKMSDTGKQYALQVVNSLVANGGTDIAEGLRKGGKVMKDRREKNPVASIILLSDGQDNYARRGANSDGRTNHQFRVPESINVPVHAFGFGKDHDASLMHSISDMSGGTFSFIETESVIQDAFAQCIGGLLSVVVKGLQVIIESANPSIRVQYLKTGSYVSHLTADGKSGCIEVGDLYADEERDFLVSVNIPKDTELTYCEGTLLLKVHCSYTDLIANETTRLVDANVTVQRPESVGNENVVSVEVDRQRNRLESAKAMVQARTAAEEGDMTRAVSIIENFRKVLSETVAAKSGDRLCMELDAELKEMQDRMASWDVYDRSGRAYMLSGLSSHASQRATARGDPTNGSSLAQSYQTPLMTEMLTRSQANPFQPAGSSQAQPRPS